MRVLYIPHNQKMWEDFFNVQAAQSGHGMVGFRGTAYQRGGGFGSLIGGLLKSFLPVAKTIGKTVGKQALRTGVEVAADALSGRNLGQSFEERGKAGAVKLLAKGAKRLEGKQQKRKTKKKTNQKGRGLGFRKSTRAATGRLKKTAVSRGRRTHRDQLGVYVA